MAGTILTKYAIESLPIEEKARLGCLPERLTFGEILCLWEPDKQRRDRYKTALENAYEVWQQDQGKGLKAEGSTGISYRGYPDKTEFDILCDRKRTCFILDDDTYSCTAHRDDFRHWLEQDGEWPLPSDCLLSCWWNSVIPEAEPNAKVSGKPVSRGHIFISYCRENIQEVTQLRNDLEAAGLTVWMDVSENLSGETWELVIRKEIEKASAAVICLSKEVTQHNRGFFWKELGFVINEYCHRKPGNSYLHLVKLSNCEIPDIRLYGTTMLKDVHCEPLFPTERYKMGLKKLIDSLQNTTT